MKEIWKDIPGYEWHYQINKLGDVRSLDRRVNYEGGYTVGKKGKIMSVHSDRDGYLRVKLSKEGKSKTIGISVLVAITFLNHQPSGSTSGLVVDHIDNNKLNNHVDNLQIITNRENTTKDKKGLVGASWNKTNKKWISEISIKGERIYLGAFNKELEASNAYQDKLKEIE